MGAVAPGPPEAKIALPGIGHTIEQAVGKDRKADILVVEAVAQDLGLGPRLCGGGRRQALPRVEGGGDGLEIRGVRLAIPLTNELESTVVGEPAREAARQSVTLL